MEDFELTSDLNENLYDQAWCQAWIIYINLVTATKIEIKARDLMETNNPPSPLQLFIERSSSF